MPKTTITIEADFGSDFQAEVAMNILRPTLDAWATLVRERHKKNRITWSATQAPTEKATRSRSGPAKRG